MKRNWLDVYMLDGPDKAIESLAQQVKELEREKDELIAYISAKLDEAQQWMEHNGPEEVSD